MWLKQEIGKRIQIFVKEKGWKKVEFAEKMGIYPQNVNKYFSGEFDFTNIIDDLMKEGCDLTWLLTGKETQGETMGTLGTLEEGQEGQEGHKGREGHKGQEGQKGYEYPVVSLIGAGEVIPFDNEVEEYVLFPYKHKNCVALRVQGDSMIPFIEDGDVVLVDLVKRPNQGDIVAVRTKAGEQFIKKLMVVERNKRTFHLFSLNPAYPLRAFNFEEVETVKKVVMVLKDTDYGNGD